MPLQIRRGTEQQRTAMTVPLASGELLYVTDDQRLFIGNGNTLGGVQITGYTNEDAQDAAAQLFSNGSHTGISFTYNDAANSLSALVDLANYQGTIGATSFKGSVFADDSTTLVDAVDGKIVGEIETLNGSITNLISSNFDVENISALGVAGVNIGAGGFNNLVVLQNEVRIQNVPLIASTGIQGALTGNVTGNVSGNLTGNVTGNLTGNSDGFHTGDVKGSVFADDSTLLVDAIDRRFFGSIDTGGALIDQNILTVTSGNQFFVGTDDTSLDLTFKLNNNLQVRQIIDPLGGSGFITYIQSRGTLASPAAAQANDELGGLLVRAFTDSSTPAVAAAFGVIVDPTAVIAGGNFIKSQIILSASTDTTQDPADAFLLDSAGIATSNAFVASKFIGLPVYADDAARSAAIPTPATGMMVFMTSGTSPSVTNKAVVYDSTAWVALH